MRKFFCIFAFELKKFFADKKSCLSALLLPGLTFLVLYGFLTQVTISQNSEGSSILVAGSSSFIDLASIDDSLVVDTTNEIVSLEEARRYMQEDGFDVVVVLPQNFDALLANYSQSNAQNDANIQHTSNNIDVFYDSASTTSLSAYSKVTSYLNAVQDSFPQPFTVNMGSSTYDVNSEGEAGMASTLMSMVFPFLIISMTFSSSVSIAAESIAGEKERKTLSSLLMCPISMKTFAVAKIISLSVIALVAALITTMCAMLALTNYVNALSEAETSISLVPSMDTTCTLIALMVVAVITMTSLVVLVSANSKTTRDTQLIMTPFSIFVAVIPLIGTTLNFASGINFVYLIPFAGISFALSDALAGTLLATNGIFAILGCILLFVVIVLITGKCLQSEKCRFGT